MALFAIQALGIDCQCCSVRKDPLIPVGVSLCWIGHSVKGLQSHQIHYLCFKKYVEAGHQSCWESGCDFCFETVLGIPFIDYKKQNREHGDTLLHKVIEEMCLMSTLWKQSIEQKGDDGTSLIDLEEDLVSISRVPTRGLNGSLNASEEEHLLNEVGYQGVAYSSLSNIGQEERLTRAITLAKADSVTSLMEKYEYTQREIDGALLRAVDCTLHPAPGMVSSEWFYSHMRQIIGSLLIHNPSEESQIEGLSQSFHLADGQVFTQIFSQIETVPARQMCALIRQAEKESKEDILQILLASEHLHPDELTFADRMDLMKIAAQAKQWTLVQTLWLVHERPPDEIVQSIILVGVGCGNLDILQWICAKGCCIQEKTFEEALVLAYSQGNLEIIGYLHEKKCIKSRSCLLL